MQMADLSTVTHDLAKALYAHESECDTNFCFDFPH